MIKILFLIFTVITLAASRQHRHFYRKDFTYFEEFDAFYKLHWDLYGLSWNSAFLACDDEEAKLFYPKEEGEWAVVKKLASKSKIDLNVTEIFVGIHDEYGLGEYITVDGHATPSPLSEDDNLVADGKQCMVIDIETGVYSTGPCSLASDDVPRPFVCKKIDDNPCPTVDRGYSYFVATKKCYKINERPKTWQEAMHTCFMEGGVLLTIDSQTESKLLYDFYIKNSGDYYIGFNRLSPTRDFYTVKGQKLDSSGFSSWIDDNHDRPGNCGTIRRYLNYQGLYYDAQNCDNALPFVCEMEPKV